MGRDTGFENELRSNLEAARLSSGRPLRAGIAFDAPRMHSNATAPEHAVGVDDRELAQIVSAFHAGQVEMMSGGHPVSNVFQAPGKRDVVRLNNKVLVFQMDRGWMTPAEAKAEIGLWRAHTAA